MKYIDCSKTSFVCILQTVACAYAEFFFALAIRYLLCFQCKGFPIMPYVWLKKKSLVHLKKRVMAGLMGFCPKWTVLLKMNV